MKKKLCLLVAAVLLISLALQSCGSADKEDGGPFRVEEKLLTVDITLPAALFKDKTPEEIKAAAEENGYLGCTVNEDGSVTYTMTKLKYSEMLEKQRQNIDDTIESLVSGDKKVTAFTKIEYNDDASEFRIYYDTEKSAMLDKLYILTFYVAGLYYQSFSGKAQDDIDVIVKFIDAKTDEVISTSSYKEYSENMASAGNSDDAADTAEAEPAKAEPTVEIVGSEIVGFRSSLGDPKVSAYVAVKNTSDYCIRFKNTYFEYMDNDGKLLAVDKTVNCIPDALKPGQVGYIYSYHFDISDVDLTNGLRFAPKASVAEAKDYFEIDVSDLSLSTGRYFDVEIIGRGTNNTGKDRSFVDVSAIIYDTDGKVIGFCYGIESFPEGGTEAFTISGDLMSADYDPSAIASAEVFIQSSSRY